MRSILKFCLTAALVAFTSACVTGTRLSTGPADQPGSGTYDLYLYGCRHADDIENVVFLVRSDLPHRFEIFDIDASFKIRKGIPAGEAFREARTFIRCGFHSLWMEQLQRVGSGNDIIGYELRPVYQPHEVGTGPVLQISYLLTNGTVRAYIRPLHERNRDRFERDHGRPDRQ